ncbi:drug resistance MFS transporter, drug:H+ antiporter-2 family [Proteus penneri ATCC 35198]|nr:drug resistance MFS transporter, drug:H+ antiporter-2 family [Proteus penneri ATCC 35198]
MLDQGKELDWFNSTEIIVLTIVAVVALSFLIVWELTDDHPVIDLSLFKSRNFTIGCVTLSLAYMIYFGTIVLLPLLLQEVFGYTATWAGLASASVGLLPLIITPIIGKFGGKVDLRYIISFSFIIFSVCFYWRAYTFEPGMDFATVAWPQFWQGLAVACFFMPLTTMTLSGLPPEKMASASSLSNFLRTLAGAIGASLTTTIWTQRESLHHETFVEKINPLDPDSQMAFQQMNDLGLSNEQASAYLAKTITEQGLIISANEIFWLAAGIFLIMMIVVWFAKPPFSPGK